MNPHLVPISVFGMAVKLKNPESMAIVSNLESSRVINCEQAYQAWLQSKAFDLYSHVVDMGLPFPGGRIPC